MRIGYKLIAEAYGPTEMVRQAVRAEEAGFDFVEISDHYHPWVSEQQHSGFAWSMLAAMAARTERIELATGVTCPMIRYHPAIIAQAAATTQILADGRFTLGVGSGERLNEHVVGRAGPRCTCGTRCSASRSRSSGCCGRAGTSATRPAPHARGRPGLRPARRAPAHRRRRRWRAGLGARGRARRRHLRHRAARRPRRGVPRRRAARARLRRGPARVGADEHEAAESAPPAVSVRPAGWKVQAELPNPINFEAATAFVTAETCARLSAAGRTPRATSRSRRGSPTRGSTTWP